jgi:hypothetical protein
MSPVYEYIVKPTSLAHTVILRGKIVPGHSMVVYWEGGGGGVVELRVYSFILNHYPANVEKRVSS